MLYMNYVMDTYQELHTAKEGFCKAVKRLAEATEYIQVRNGLDITLLSVCPRADLQKDHVTTFYVLSRKSLQEFEETSFLSCGYVRDDVLGSKQLIDEMKETTQLCAIIGDQKLLISQLAIGQIGRVAGATGDYTLNNPSLVRNMELAEALAVTAKPINLIVRRYGDAAKIFGARLGFDIPTKQDIFVDILKMLGKNKDPSFDHGIVGTEATEMFLRVNGADVGNLNGYISVKTSDIGKASFTVRSLLQVSDHPDEYAYVEERTHKHVREIPAEEIISDIRELAEDLRLKSKEMQARISVTLPPEEYLEKLRDVLKETKPYLGKKRTVDLLQQVLSYKDLRERTRTAQGRATLESEQLTYDRLFGEIISLTAVKSDATSEMYTKKVVGRMLLAV